MILVDWAERWGLPPQALQELAQSCLCLTPSEDATAESDIQRELRLEAARLDKLLFRNNRGAGHMETKRRNGSVIRSYVRYGLANDSKNIGDEVKSADLVGIERILITPQMVGQVVGRFLSVEVKAADWKYRGTPEEVAQVKWATTINAYGGRALITNRLGVL